MFNVQALVTRSGDKIHHPAGMLFRYLVGPEDLYWKAPLRHRKANR
jgi:hypothetical protein